ncbi:MAG TPA: ribosome-associated translation inhibitor RaiA [Longimicrobiales bacterium]
MNVSISARHCSVSERTRTEAQERLRRLQRLEPRLANAEVEFDDDHGTKQVETRIFVNGSHSIVAHGSGDTFRTALDRSIDRLTRQLKRRRDRIRDHKAPKMSEIDAVNVWRPQIREAADD